MATKTAGEGFHHRSYPLQKTQPRLSLRTSALDSIEKVLRKRIVRCDRRNET